MTSRRLATSAIDWVKFAERVPEEQKLFFQAFKAKSDGYLRKAFSLAEAPPPVSWAYYKSRGLPTDLVDKFESQLLEKQKNPSRCPLKQYSTMKIPYPKETTTPIINVQEKETEKQIEAFVFESKKRIGALKKELEYWDNLLPFEYMTCDDFKDAFPGIAHDPLNRPTAWPHTTDLVSAPKE